MVTILGFVAVFGIYGLIKGFVQGVKQVSEQKTTDQAEPVKQEGPQW